MTQVFLTSPTGALQTSTSDATWNNSNNSVECIGSGASGAAGVVLHATGGGGGQYAKITNFTFATPGTTTYQWQIGTGGTQVTSINAGGVAGNTTWFNAAADPGAGSDNSKCSAKGGSPGATAVGTVNGGAGGTGGWGTTLNTGGRGGNLTGASGTLSSGGGGAAGPNGAGGQGIDSSGTGNSATNGGQGDVTFGGAAGIAATGTGQQTGGNGGAGTELGDSIHGCGGGGGGARGTQASNVCIGGSGGLYGGGGAGGTNSTTGAVAQKSGAGAAGIIVLTWTPAVTFTNFGFQPLSEPVQAAKSRNVALRETKTEGFRPVVPFSYYQNLSDPVRTKPNTARFQAAFPTIWYNIPFEIVTPFGISVDAISVSAISARDEAFATTAVSIAWAQPFSTPLYPKGGLYARYQQPFAVNTNPVVPFSYYNALSEPQRQKTGFKAQLQNQFFSPVLVPSAITISVSFSASDDGIVSFAKSLLYPSMQEPVPVVATPFVYGFFDRLSEPQRQPQGLKAHLQNPFTIDTNPVVTFSYYNPLSEPTRRKGIQPQLGVQANWYVYSYIPTDHIAWWNNFSEPVRKYGLRIAAEPASFFTYNEPINYVSWWQDFSRPVLRVGIKTATGDTAHWWSTFTPPAPSDLGYISWWSNFSDPVRRTGIKTHLQSTTTFDPKPEFPISYGYYNPLSEPVRQKIGLKTHLQSTTTFDPQREFPINVSSWWANFTDPVRRAGIKVSTFDPANWWSTFTPPAPTDLGYISWWRNFDDPVRRRGIRPEYQQTFTSPHLQPTVTFGYYMPWSEPVRLKKGISYTLQQITAAPYNPTITFGYYNWWSEPQRQKRGLGAHLQRETTAPFNPTVSFSYFSRLSEPQRLYKPRLNVALQQFYTSNIFPLPTVAAPAWFFEWLSEPVRLKRGLSARLQQTFAWPPKIIAGQVVTGIINAFQLNTDTAEISVFVRNYNIPTHAIVSIEEISNGYNISIPHYLTSVQEIKPDSGSQTSVQESKQDDFSQTSVYEIPGTGGAVAAQPSDAGISGEAISGNSISDDED